jgi:hypothetical protein
MRFKLAGPLCWLCSLGGHAGYDYKLAMLDKLGG